DALAIALDVRWPGAAQWQSALREAADAAAAASSFVERLLSFDGEARGDSTGALEYASWRAAVGWPADGDTASARALVRAVDAGATLGERDRRALLEAAARAELHMEERYGRGVVSYGQGFRLGPADGSGPAVGGAIWTHEPEWDWEPDDLLEAMEAPLRVFHVFTESDDRGRRYALSGGRSLRLTVLSDPVESYSVVLWGQSE